jgi:hypothetical protein
MFASGSIRELPFGQSQLASATRVLKRFDHLRMNFDQIGFHKKSFDPGPQSDQHQFQFAAAKISESHPDDLGWRAFDHKPVEEVSIPCEFHQALLSGGFP